MARPTYKIPDADVKAALRAGRRQSDALRDAIELDLILDQRFDHDGNASDAAKQLAKYIRGANDAVSAALRFYDLMVTHTEALAELEGWERTR